MLGTVPTHFSQFLFNSIHIAWNGFSAFLHIHITFRRVDRFYYRSGASFRPDQQIYLRALEQAHQYLALLVWHLDTTFHFCVNSQWFSPVYKKLIQLCFIVDWHFHSGPSQQYFVEDQTNATSESTRATWILHFQIYFYFYSLQKILPSSSIFWLPFIIWLLLLSRR